jgi:UDP-glucuronate decarboxylase
MHPNDGRVVSNFIIQSLKGEPITIYGDGLQTRSFCYVDDLIDAILRFMQTDDEITGPVNIGNPDEFTILELAQKIMALMGSDSDLEFKPLPQDDPVQRSPDISKARELMDWEPCIDLDEGLEKTIFYFENLLKKSVTQ